MQAQYTSPPISIFSLYCEGEKTTFQWPKVIVCGFPSNWGYIGFIEDFRFGRLYGNLYVFLGG